MAELTTIVVPIWLVIIVAFWFLASTIDNILNIWLFYLRRRIADMEATTTTTVCSACNTWMIEGMHYCPACGADLKKY